MLVLTRVGSPRRNRNLNQHLRPRRNHCVQHSCNDAARPHLIMSTHSSATDGDAQDAEAPKIEALFLIRFDKKVGYVA
jgi:hypothetical protein